MSRRARSAALLVAAMLVARGVHAQKPVASPDEAALERAKVLFRQGNELRKAGDCARALAFYRESRSLVPSVANTTNSAVCMAELGLDDEALEMYEELLLQFRAELTDEETRALGVATTALRRKLGRVDVSSNVQGLVVIDGRTRGQLPLVTPIPVVPGSHVLRVIKEGYETFEQRVSVAVGATVNVDAKLVPLVHAGRLRVEVDGDDAGAEILVDGGVVGTAPWEGTLTTGPHVLAARRGSRGTAPMRASVVENQTVTTHATLAELGPELRVLPEPLSSRVAIDGVDLGGGEWRGPLPVGMHVVEVRADGYLPKQVTIDVGPTPIEPLRMQLELDPARASALARRGITSWGETWAALAIGPGLGSGAEQSCDRTACSDRSVAIGGMFGARIGFELANRVSFHIGGGYLSTRATLSRRIESSFASTAAGGATSTVPLTYDLHDTVNFSGPFAGAGVGYVVPLGGIVELKAAADVGIVLARTSDTITGTVSGGGRTLDLAIASSGAAAHGASAFVLPEVMVRARFGRFYVGAGAAVGVFFLRGPSLDTGSAAPKGFDCGAHPGTADCAPASDLVRGERGFGPAVMALPSVHVGFSP